jgi:hypothetical protein
MAVLAHNANAQESVSGETKGMFTYGFDTQYSGFQGVIKTIEISPVNLGYHFGNRFSAGLRHELSVGLFDPRNDGEETSWRMTENLGAVLEYRIGMPTLKFSSGTTLGGNGNDWKYTYYSGGIYLQGRGKVSPTVGLGFRYYRSRTSGYDDHRRVFISVGFNINHKKDIRE